MTKLEALKMVRNAQLHLETFGRHASLAYRLSLRALESAERGLEFESFFEAGGEVRRAS